jgi:hypothetical protein
MWGAAGVAREHCRPRVLLLSINYGDEVIPLSSTLLVSNAWLLQMVICCVLAKCKE